jgi:uncharacterized protein involved in cysteine biosynthesis
MSLNRKRIRAVLLKEFREYRRNSLIIGTMAVMPAVVIAIPLVVLVILPASAACPTTTSCCTSWPSPRSCPR